jgi:hypothetical protein
MRQHVLDINAKILDGRLLRWKRHVLGWHVGSKVVKAKMLVVAVCLFDPNPKGSIELQQTNSIVDLCFVDSTAG